jgi:hypothetical protein
VAVWGLLGYLSLRFLRRLPDFEDKAAMMQGAKWGWLWWLGAIAASLLVMYFGFAYLPMTSTWIAGLLSMGILFLWFFGFPHQAWGSMAVLWGASSDLGKLGVQEWLEQRKQNGAKRRRGVRIVAVMWVLVLGGDLGLGVRSYCKFDRQFLQCRRVEALQEDVKRELSSPYVGQVVLNDIPFSDGNGRLWIILNQTVTPAQARGLAESAGRILAAKGLKPKCKIIVKLPRKKPLATGRYSPP